MDLTRSNGNDAQVAARRVIANLGRTEDVKFSPSNLRLAVAGFKANRIAFFDVTEIVRVAEATGDRLKRYLQWRLSTAMFNRFGYLSRTAA